MRMPPFPRSVGWRGQLLLVGFAAAAAAIAAWNGPGRAGAAPIQAAPALSLGTLVGRDARVTVLATPQGARYDVRSADGTVIAARATADEVARCIGQDPRAAWAEEEPVKLMLAEPDVNLLGRE